MMWLISFLLSSYLSLNDIWMTQNDNDYNVKITIKHVIMSLIKIKSLKIFNIEILKKNMWKCQILI
jgi:hypothetical protein